MHELDSIHLEKPKVEHARNYIFYFNVEKHSYPYHDEFSLLIEKRCILKSGGLGVPSQVTTKFLREYYDTIPENRKKIFLKLLINPILPENQNFRNFGES